MNLFQILATDMCNNTLVSTVIGAVKTIFTIIQIAIPIVLIVYCTIDMFKAITSGDEKKTKEAWKTAGRRLIYAIIAFLIPWLVSLVFSKLTKEDIKLILNQMEEDKEDYYSKL